MIEKILVIGDPHIQIRYLHRVKAMMADIIRVAQETHPDRIVILGDVLHTHSKLHLNLQCLALDWIEALAEITPVRLLVGNHDRLNNSDFMTDIHPFRGLEKNPNIWVAWKTLAEEALVYVPYVSPGRFQEALAGIDLNQTRAIFAHQEVHGCKLGPGVVSEIGDPWSLENPMVYSGHIHGRQQVQPNWLYIGAPMQHAYGDSPNRSISLLNWNGSKFDEERIFLKVDQLITLEISTEELLDLEIPENAQVRVRVSGTSAQLKAVPDQIWKDLKAQGVQIDKKTLGIQRVHNLEPGQTFVELLLKSCDELMKIELQNLILDPWA